MKLSTSASSYPIASDLGTLKGIYRVKISVGYFLPLAGLLAVALIGLAIWWGSISGWQRYVSFAVFLLFTAPFVWAIWKTLPRMLDRLSIYEKGFVYERSRELTSCKWDEITDVTEILDLGDRLKITAVRRKCGGPIAFAYKMRGLDVLSHDYHLYETPGLDDSDIAETQPNRELGPVVGAYRVRHGSETFIPLGAVLFLFAVGSVSLVAVPDILGKVICTGIPGIVFFVVLWSLISEWNEKMTVHENGFSYKSRKGVVDCAWDEIVDYSTTTRRGTLTGVKKDDGTWIGIAGDMRGVDLIKPHLRKVIEWKGPED